MGGVSNVSEVCKKGALRSECWIAIVSAWGGGVSLLLYVHCTHFLLSSLLAFTHFVRNFHCVTL